MDSSWLWILGFIGVMFVMHRFGLGCCGGHSHGGHSGHGHDSAKGELPDKTGAPVKQANSVMASSSGNSAGMSCCGGHAHGGPPESTSKQGVEGLPQESDEGERGREKVALLRPMAGERKGDG
jgi:hypothetical protein